MKIASLDMGSNTTLMLICEVIDGTVTQVYSDHSTVTRLGQDVDKTGVLHPDALDRLDQCLGLYKDIINQENVEKIVAVATSAARDANNKDDFYKITDGHNIPVKIIPGEVEAEVTFAGSTYDLGNSEGLTVVDVGGGSTEIIAKVDGQVVGHSLDIGSVRLTERFISSHPIKKDELQRMDDFLEQELQSKKDLLPPTDSIKNIVAVAGTPTTLAMVKQSIEFDEDKVHRYELDVQDFEHWREKLASMSVDKRQELTGMNPKRADVIVAGISILAATLKFLGQKKLIVSTKGVRYGLAIKHDSI